MHFFTCIFKHTMIYFAHKMHYRNGLRRPSEGASGTCTNCRSKAQMMSIKGEDKDYPHLIAPSEHIMCDALRISVAELASIYWTQTGAVVISVGTQICSMCCAAHSLLVVYLCLV